MEAEYNALLMVMKDLIPFHNCVDTVATSIGYNYTVQTQFQTVVWEDSNGTIVLAGQEPGHMTPRSKHYGVKYHLFQTNLHNPANHMSIK